MGHIWKATCEHTPERNHFYYIDGNAYWLLTTISFFSKIQYMSIFSKIIFEGTSGTTDSHEIFHISRNKWRKDSRDNQLSSIEQISIFTLFRIENQYGNIHTEEQAFSCKICGLAFSHHSSLKCHMEKHIGEKLFSCEVCGSTFSESASLKIHMQTHSGEKSFSFKDCRSAFSEISSYELWDQLFLEVPIQKAAHKHTYDRNPFLVKSVY